ncbi:MAG: ABC transporter ATP-binding protein [Smithellaceae bacterium]|nr:ABC transporter ATP-binding protein [Smithellaceae bacterium]
MQELIKAINLEKSYQRGAETVHALSGVSFSLMKGEFTAITGQSGSGKTTLLHILGCLDRATSGMVYLDGVSLEEMNDKALDRVRREKIGFVFQQFYLLPGLTVVENITLPLLFTGEKPDEKKIEDLLESVGLAHRRTHLPRELSGGEMQRVAIARALVNDPEFIMADEPTANLDTTNSLRIFDLLQSLSERGITVIVVTHNPGLAKRARRQIYLKDGLIVEGA